MFQKTPRKHVLNLIILFVILAVAVSGYTAGQALTVQAAFQPPASQDQSGPTAPAAEGTIFIPLVANQSPWVSPFAVETTLPQYMETKTIPLAKGLDINAMRLNGLVSWREAQPDQNIPPDLTKLATFDNEMRLLRANGITPMVIVDDFPTWATIENKYCAPLKSSEYSTYANFLRQLVRKYSKPEFNVHIWEIGNEVDFPFSLAPMDNQFGCWGDANADYFGGLRYGNMLKVVSMAIKDEDPKAQVWIGGLLLDAPSSDPTASVQGNFLRGIFASGAGDYIDMVPFHAYPPYINRKVDHDTSIGGPWASTGGAVIGKVAYIRQIMAEFGVNKPIYYNETSLMCPEVLVGQPTTWCDPPSSAFFQMQADHLVKVFSRSLSVGVVGISWYALDDPGWRYVGLVDPSFRPRPAYQAFRVMVIELKGSHYTGKVDYGSRIEAYAFKRGTQQVQVVWTKDDIQSTVTIPASQFVSAVSRDGAALHPSTSGGNVIVPVSFDPIYIIQNLP